jgi:hypothetical protein
MSGDPAFLEQWELDIAGIFNWAIIRPVHLISGQCPSSPTIPLLYPFPSSICRETSRATWCKWDSYFTDDILSSEKQT